MGERDAGRQPESQDRRDAHATHGADREPTPDEERLADAQELDPEVARAYEEATERGAHVRGEGDIAPPGS